MSFPVVVVSVQRVELVRCLHSQADREHIRELLSQFRNVGRTLLKTFVESQTAK